MKRIRRILYRFVTGALLLNVIWYLFSLVIDSNALVSPIEVYRALWAMSGGTMAGHLWASLRRLLVGLPIAFVIGAVCAWLIYRYRPFGRVANALVYLCYPIPKLTLLPIVMLLAGLGDEGKVAMIVLILVFQIIINLRDSLINIPRESFLITTSLGAGSFSVLRHVVIPATLPDALSTLRVAIGTAISVLFVTETYGTEKGMGYFIVDAWMRLDYVQMYGGIVVLSMVGFLLFILTDLIEAYSCGWRSTEALSDGASRTV